MAPQKYIFLLNLKTWLRAWANSGPRATCDPSQRFQWPTKTFKKILKSDISFTLPQ